MRRLRVALVAGSLKVAVIGSNLTEPIAVGYCTWQWLAVLTACLLHIHNPLWLSGSNITSYVSM